MSSQDERYAKALTAFGEGDFEVADELLAAVERSGIPTDGAADLRIRLDGAVRQRRITELRQAAGRLVAQGEYELASSSLNRAKELEADIVDDEPSAAESSRAEAEEQLEPESAAPEVAIAEEDRPAATPVEVDQPEEPAVSRPMDWDALTAISREPSLEAEQAIPDEPSEAEAHADAAHGEGIHDRLAHGIENVETELEKLEIGWWLTPRRLALTIAAIVLVGVIAFLGLKGLSGNSTTPSVQPGVATIDVRLTASEPSAAIFIDGAECGRGSCLSQLAPGSYELEARLAGFSPASRRLTIPSTGMEEDGPIVLPLVPLPTSLVISGNLESAEVWLDGESIGVIEDGEFEVPGLPTGDHTLEIGTERSSLSVAIRIADGQEPLIDGESRATKLSWAGVGGLGDRATVYTGSSDARLVVEGREPLPFEAGRLAVNSGSDAPLDAVVEAGRRKHQVILESSPAPTLRLFLESERAVGTLRIATGVDDATVYFNDTVYRRKTRNGRLLVYLYPNTYKVRVEKAGFTAPAERTVSIVDGKNIQIELPLKAMPQTATLRVSGAVPGTSVVIDGKFSGRVGPTGDFELGGVAVGSHEIALREELHRESVIRREFARGAMVEIKAAQESIAGILQIAVTPESIDAAISLQREGESRARNMAGETVKLPAGTYTVTATAPGVEPYAATVRLLPNEIKTVRLELIRKLAPARRLPAFGLEDWISSSGWRSDADLAVRRGGGLTLASRQLGTGTAQFLARVDRGKRLEWRVSFVDDKNFIACQLDRNQFQRQAVVNGKKLPRVRLPHGVNPREFVAMKIEIRRGSVVHQVQRDGAWVKLDEMKSEGAAFDVGHFGFRIPGSDQVSLRSFQFVSITEPAGSSE